MKVADKKGGDILLSEAVDLLHAATAVYTTEPVVDQLLDQLGWPSGNLSLVDPSAGNGMFIIRALERLIADNPQADVLDFQRLEGWEIHPQACEEARLRIANRLQIAGKSVSDARDIAARMITCADFLTEGPTTPRWDIIAGNPPYLRWLNIPALLRNLYDEVVPGYAAADMLHSFLDRCVKCLEPQGRIGFVTADRWLFGQRAAALRERLGQCVEISHLTRLDARSAFFRPKDRRAGTPARVHPVAVILSPAHNKMGLPLTASPIYPGVDSRDYEGKPKLGDLATVKLAPWLGTDGVFLIDAVTAAALPAHSTIPTFTPDDWNAPDDAPPAFYAIRTRPQEEPHPDVKEHLRRHMDSMSERAKKAGPWQPPETFHRWDMTKPILVLPRILKDLNARLLPAGRLPVSHQLAIQCDSEDQLLAVQKALQSDIALRWLRDHAPRLENSYHQLSAPLLRQMPLQMERTTHRD